MGWILARCPAHSVASKLKSMTKEVEKELKRIIAWIVEHNEETEAIDKINSVTFPFTTKYLGFSNRKQKEVESGDIGADWNT